jgi:hypothetical protein
MKFSELKIANARIAGQWKSVKGRLFILQGLVCVVDKIYL